ncbi:excalibur calcium-binding domain-containing protein [Planococcus shenhongbingii]|uniref:LPXTG cell wall anchor domain-containing protein n=1 Tax=Planococcus shenhongbingii TaxID=3058398 RepID=UPI002609115D|nr:excalibur calcium-binding domain-containing protein [Planococcus sp. N016]WKA59499.1 excalibur calcium-binding domain-containing protein [Planococcus sp. N016]
MLKKTVLGSSMILLLVAGTSLDIQAAVNDKDCGDFSSHQEVMEFWYANGFSADNDPHGLDRDNDGLACEVSQSEYNSFVASKEADDSSDDAATEEEAATGEELPDTASNNPLMMLFGAGIAGLGSLLLFRRKSQQA